MAKDFIICCIYPGRPRDYVVWEADGCDLVSDPLDASIFESQEKAIQVAKDAIEGHLIFDDCHVDVLRIKYLLAIRVRSLKPKKAK
jgi:hypothetical protein